MGRKSYAADALSWCVDNGWDVVAVVTDNHQETSPTANAARKFGLRLLDYDSLLEAINSDTIEFDLAVSYVYWRILKKPLIQSPKLGILNFHPGLLPIIRGLDSILWSIYYDQNIGVTAHLISEKIDSGFLVYQEKVKVCIDDDIYSLYEKNYQLQLKLIPISLNLIKEKKDFKLLEHNGPYNTKMSYLKQLDVVEIIDQYINRYSKIDEKN